MEKKMRLIQAKNLNQLVKGANELGIKQEDIVQFITIDNGFILIYFG